MNSPTRRENGTRAFSLVEVVLALAICTFALVAILGLFATGIQSNRESEQQIQAANLASMIISMRTSSPTNDIPKLPNLAIPTLAMTNLYGNAYDGGATLTNYIGLDGQIATAATAAYTISCRAGTNAATGVAIAQLYLMLSWPAQLNPTNSSAGHYEAVAQIPLH